MALLRHYDLVIFLVDPEVADAVFFRLAHKLWRHVVNQQVKLGRVFRLPGDDERRARFVDQNRVDFIDNCVHQLALHALGRLINHVVA